MSATSGYAKKIEQLIEQRDSIRAVNAELLEALERFELWADSQSDAQSKGGHATFDIMALREERDAARAAIARAALAQAQSCVPAEPATRPANSQDWAGMSASTAYLLIGRHADGWDDIDLMLNEWRLANPSPQPQPVQPRNCEWTNCPRRVGDVCCNEQAKPEQADQSEQDLAVAQPERVPLTIQEVEQINARWNYELHGDRLRFVVREVEAAHHITKKE